MKQNNKVSVIFLLATMFIMIFSLQISMPVNSEVQSQTARPTVKIGGLGPLAITPGQDMKNGMDLAIEEINVNGFDVSGTMYDFQAYYETTSGTDGLPSSGQAGTGLTNLKGDGVVAVIGGFRTEVVVAIQSQLGALPMIGVGSTAPIITPYFWRAGPTNGTELAYSLIEFYHVFVKALGVQNVTIVREDADWSLAISKGIKGAFGAYFPTDFNFTTDTVISQSATLDSVISTMTPLKESGSGAFLTLFSAPVGKSVAEAWSTLNMTQLLAGINVESQRSDYFDGTAGGAYGEIELETTSPDVVGTTKAENFKSAYFAKYNEYPTYTAYASYDAVYILKEALEKSSDVTSTQIQVNLASTDYNGTAFRIKFTSEPGSQLGVNSTGDKVPIPGTLDNITVHDLYTPDGIGTSGNGYANPVFVQWQKGGVKKTVYSTVANFVAVNITNLQWPVNHADSGYVPHSTSTTATSSTTSSTGTGTSSATSVATSQTTSTTESASVPGYGMLMILFAVSSFILLRKYRKITK